MRSNFSFKLLLVLCFVLNGTPAQAQTSGFTYQGKLTNAGAAADGQYDFTFKLFDTDDGGLQIESGAPLPQRPCDDDQSKRANSNRRDKRVRLFRF